MSDWRPTSSPAAAQRRAQLLQRARDYFAGQQVLAVDTPSLSRFAASDPHIESFAVKSTSSGDHYLHTSPEFCMKRLLAAGYPDIYSICRVYRDGEAGCRHLPEFTMLEWYRHDFGLADIVADTTRLIAACLEQHALADTAVTLEYLDAFKKFAKIDASEASIDELCDCVSADATLRETLGDDRDAWLDLALDTVVAQRFADDRLTVLQHFPASRAALARLCPGDERLADRFEVFLGTTELANGYVELTDVGEQRGRIDSDLAQRKAGGKLLRPHDEKLLAALDAGLPECAGVAVGVERMQMIYDRSNDIAGVVTFGREDYCA